MRPWWIKAKVTPNEEVADALESRCGHTHAKDEWQPKKVTTKGGATTWRYPSHEEAEYPAHMAFNVAVATSWAVVKQGLDTELRLPVNCGKCSTRMRALYSSKLWKMTDQA